MNDVVITKVNGGIGRRNPSDDMICGLMANGVAVPGGVQLDTTYRLAGVQDAIDLLIDEAYDFDNDILVYEHIKEFFRINPDGDLYLRLAAQAVSFSDLVNKTKTHAPVLLSQAEGNIKVLAVAFNPAVFQADFTATDAAIPVAQDLVSDEYAQHRPIQVVLEGKGFDINAPSNLRALNAPNVSVMVGQELSIVNKDTGGQTPYATYAAVGTFLGAVSKAAVNESVAWVSKFNLLGGSLIAPAVTGTAMSDISQGAMDTANDYGHIFFRTFTGLAGIYLNDSHTCIAVTDDFAYIQNGRTIDKAVRGTYLAMLPSLNAPVALDDQGRLPSEVAKKFEMDVNRFIEGMLGSNEISSYTVFVDPEQDILSSGDLKVQITIVPTGTSRNISVTIGYINPFSA